MNRRDLLKTAAGNLAAYGLLSPLLPIVSRASETHQPGTTQNAGKPNIVVILSDDLGYGELGCQGGTDIPTPNIDSIARGGVRFTNAYVSCPVCSPTRAGLLTGRYQQRFGHEFNAAGAGPDFGLPHGETTMANCMKSLGYATGIVGKWHLGEKENLMPTERGFDEFFGFLGGAHPYFANQRKARILRGTDVVKEKEFLTDAFAREAVSFIDRHQAEPFFLYLAFNAVHAPMQATDDRLRKFESIADPQRRTFAAMLDALDGGVGKTLQKLRELNLDENTLVVFLSDNGGPTLKTTSNNGALSGYKGQVHEGGIRVPFMMRWKGEMPSGVVYDKPAISLDILPTALDAAGEGASLPANLDGVSLLPYIRGEREGMPHEHLFWRYGEQTAVRGSDWKLMRLGDGGNPKLFNLADDIGERNDLAAEYPGKVDELQAAYDSWNENNIAPLWGNDRSARKKKKKRKSNKSKQR